MLTVHKLFSTFFSKKTNFADENSLLLGLNQVQTSQLRYGNFHYQMVMQSQSYVQISLGLMEVRHLHAHTLTRSLMLQLIHCADCFRTERERESDGVIERRRNPP